MSRAQEKRLQITCPNGSTLIKRNPESESVFLQVKTGFNLGGSEGTHVEELADDDENEFSADDDVDRINTA
jgi:hypothetical protein